MVCFPSGVVKRVGLHSFVAGVDIYLGCKLMKTQKMACCQGNLRVAEEPITSHVVVTGGFVSLCVAAPMTSYPLCKNLSIPVPPKTDFRSVTLKILLPPTNFSRKTE